jgi:hypothetical protein
MLNFLNIQVKEVEGFPLKKRKDGSLFPAEVDVLKMYDKFIATQGLVLFEVAKTIQEDIANRHEKDPEGVELKTLNECLTVVLNPSSDPDLAATYSSEIKKIFYEQDGDYNRKIFVVTVLINTRVEQDWLKTNRKDIETGLILLPTIGKNNVELFDNKDLSIFNSSNRKPVMKTIDGELYWTLEMSYRLPETVIEAIYDYCTMADVKTDVDIKPENVEDADFLSETSEKDQKVS